MGTMSIQHHRQSWDITRIEQAKILANRSLCTRDQVGAIIVDAGNKVIGEGYNNPPAGFPRPFGKPGWQNPDPSRHESPCTNWCPRAQQKDIEEDWAWSSTNQQRAAPDMVSENGEFYFVYPSGFRLQMSEASDEVMESYGFVKVKKPGFSLSATYDDCPSLHAETNALITSDRSLRAGGTIYVTSDICMGCAKLIGNSGLARVYVDTKRYDKHRNPDASYDFMRQCGLMIEIKRPGTREGWDPRDRTV